MNKNIYFILFTIIFIHVLFFTYFINTSPLVGDGPIHMNIIESNYEKGYLNFNVPNLKGNFGFPRYIDGYPVCYPQLYYVFGTIIYPFFQHNTIYIIDFILTSLLILVSFLLAKILFSDEISLIFATLIGITPGLVYSEGNHNFMLLFNGILSLYFLLLFYKYLKISYLFLFVLAIIFTAGVKQFSYLYIFALIFGTTIYCVLKKEFNKLKFFYIGILIAIVFWLPIFIFQIYTTGTISTPAIKGWSILDTHLFKPKYMEIPKWQLEIDKIVNIEELNTKGAIRYYQVNNKYLSLISSPFEYINQFFNINTISLLPKGYRDSITLYFFIIFLILGVVLFLFQKNIIVSNSNHKKFSIKENKSIYLYFRILCFMIFLLGVPVIVLTSKVKYYLFYAFLGSLFIIIGINYFKNNKKLLIFIFFIMINLLIIYSSHELIYLKRFLNDTYMRGNIPGGYKSLIEVSKWIKDNTKENDLILAGNTQDLPYYTKRNFFWDYRLFFLNESQLLYYLQFYPNLKYIIICKNQLATNFTNWVIVPLESVFLKMLNSNEIFKKVYDKNDIYIYELNIDLLKKKARKKYENDTDSF